VVTVIERWESAQALDSTRARRSSHSHAGIIGGQAHRCTRVAHPHACAGWRRRARECLAAGPRHQ
jgi:hypothetical protein